MDWRLEAAQARVLGCLLEKEIATPAYYPLSLNALVDACNQKSNREPVVDYGEADVEEALAGLRAQGLALRAIGGVSRVAKHSQRLTEKLNLGRREAAVLCLLLLRGPQTAGELRARSGRLYDFDGLEAVEETLNRLAGMELAKQLPRQLGFKEPRWSHLLCGEPQVAAEPPAERAPSYGERIAALEAALADLQRAFDQFKKSFE